MVCSSAGTTRPRTERQARKTGLEANARVASERASVVAPVITELQAAWGDVVTGFRSGRSKPQRTSPSSRGTGTWSATQVARVLARRRDGSRLIEPTRAQAIGDGYADQWLPRGGGAPSPPRSVPLAGGGSSVTPEAPDNYRAKANRHPGQLREIHRSLDRGWLRMRRADQKLSAPALWGRGHRSGSRVFRAVGSIVDGSWSGRRRRGRVRGRNTRGPPSPHCGSHHAALEAKRTCRS